MSTITAKELFQKVQIAPELKAQMIKEADETGREVFVIGADLMNSEDDYRTSKWLWRQECLSLAAKAVFMIIKDHAFGDKDRAWPAQDKIAERLGNSISTRTVQRALDELYGKNPDNLQVLTSIRRGLTKTNIYVLLFRGHEFSYTLKDLPDTTK